MYYHNISIDHRVLAQLPEDADLSDLCTLTLNNSTRTQNQPTSNSDQNTAQPEDQNASQSEDQNAAGPTHDTDPPLENPYEADLERSFVPTVPQRMTESEILRQLVHQTTINQTPQPLSWPTTGSPLNEFTTEGYMTCAFPTLFPTGNADFLAPRLHTVTVGNYFKHLLMYHDRRFAQHPRFRYFALNSEMRWRALQTGRVYVHQHPNDARLSVDELRDMVGREGQAFSNRVLHYAGSLRGTRHYWFKQRSRLITMVDTIGLPTVFFTHSAADHQWPELAHLLSPDEPSTPTSRRKAVIDNPAISDWFFQHRIQKFIEAFYVGVLGASDYWFRFEWQHRGSPHIHGLAWFPDAPSVQDILADSNSTSREQLTKYVNKIISTTNPAVQPDGSDVNTAVPPASCNPHICSKPYADVVDFNQDLIDLIATTQRHTQCSPAYCLRMEHGQQKCRFGYPKPLQPETTVVMEDGEPVLLTARNDGLVNSFNPIQLSAWRANVDMQYCVSRKRVLEYCAKYATKCEPHSQSLKDVFSNIVRTLRDDNTSAIRAVQRLLINSVGERDYSAQETCHLLLQLPMFRASRNFIVLSLDGSRAVEEHLVEDQPATALSTLDHYVARPNSPVFRDMTLLHFTQHYTMPREQGSDPSSRRKAVVVIVRPFCSPDPSSAKYEQYCRQKLMQYVPFHRQEELFGAHSTYAAAYAAFLHSENVPPTLEDDVYRLDQQNQQRSMR